MDYADALAQFTEYSGQQTGRRAEREALGCDGGKLEALGLDAGHGVQDIGGLVIAEGQDPGGLLAEILCPPRRRVDHRAAGFGGNPNGRSEGHVCHGVPLERRLNFFKL